ncbi:nuclear transport factor 2 family protein [Mesorhizobium xinjiangense]|uniref:nuclear transport factor 2 family protein n=1 Tax=Mesorhizobium xinjiangense TaxID=2678685 RepID=UPI0012ED5B1D|nr:nuclear transport factor 2 family protein [Mesorhizobium xinjiangense]
MHRTGFVLAALALLVFPAAGLASDAESVLSRWYDALARADRTALDRLLANDAVIRLEDVGIEQTKAEFLDSIEEWEIAVDGAGIRHRIEQEEGRSVTALVCYDFPDNDLLTREWFVLSGDRISESVQASVAENCAEF